MMPVYGLAECSVGLAYIAEGDVYITGRTKDIIIRAGRNTYPHELEEAVGNTPGIRKGNVVAFGSTDPKAQTERLVIAAETNETEPQALKDLRSRINALTSDLLGMAPDEIVLTGPKTLLKTSSGKVRRGANRELFERGWLGKRQRPPWLQMTRIALDGLGPRARRMALAASAGLLPFHMGAFLTAAERGLPVVPITIRGTRSILRADSWFPRRGAIAVRVGKPVEAGEIKKGAKADVWAAALKLRDAVRKDILHHCGEPDLTHEKWPT
jgi:hypothetical protein